MIEIRWLTLCVHLLKIVFLSLFFSPFLDTAFSLNEVFELYNAPQGLAMGNALTADASGYLSHYYNPAGLAKTPKRRYEIVLVDLEAIGSAAAFGRTSSAQSLGIYRLMGELKSNPGKYTYFRFTSVPAFSMRGFGVSLLGSYQYAAESNGTDIDIVASEDIVPTVGFARNFAGNLIKVGVAGKVVLRNQLKGQFAHSALGNDDQMAGLMKEGYGIGGDIGLLVTLPNKYLPTFGAVWKDMFDTHFQTSRILNKRASGVPDKIKQSVNAAFSLHPHFSRQWKGTFAVEFKHIELVDLPLRKRAHIGIQIEDEKTWFFWLGLNQLYITAGLALRLPGGNLEVGTYGQEVGPGKTYTEDRRFFFRYTISF